MNEKIMFLVGVYGITFTAIWYYVAVKQVVITYQSTRLWLRNSQPGRDYVTVKQVVIT